MKAYLCQNSGDFEQSVRRIGRVHERDARPDHPDIERLEQQKIAFDRDAVAHDPRMDRRLALRNRTQPLARDHQFPGGFDRVVIAQSAQLRGGLADGAEAAAFDDQMIPVGGGLLALTKPWPSMLRTIWGDDDRYVQTYFSKWPNRPDLYFPGDGAKRDEDGYFWILGRVDDVLNVAGHRIGTMEVESALVEHPAVAEAAVVGRTHELKGQALAAFVTLREGFKPSPELRDELRNFVAEKIGAIARPDDILFSADLPKTRSGKIMRRLLRDIAEGRTLGDTTTLADPNVVASLKEQYEERE